MRISDWSSDVCSSDLKSRCSNCHWISISSWATDHNRPALRRHSSPMTRLQAGSKQPCPARCKSPRRNTLEISTQVSRTSTCGIRAFNIAAAPSELCGSAKSGKASCRESGCQDVLTSGVAVCLQTDTKHKEDDKP